MATEYPHGYGKTHMAEQFISTDMLTCRPDKAPKPSQFCKQDQVGCIIWEKRDSMTKRMDWNFELYFFHIFPDVYIYIYVYISTTASFHRRGISLALAISFCAALIIKMRLDKTVIPEIYLDDG